MTRIKKFAALDLIRFGRIPFGNPGNPLISEILVQTLFIFFIDIRRESVYIKGIGVKKCKP